MKKIINNIGIIAGVLFTIFSTACSSFLDEKPPATKLSSSLVFQYDATAEEAIAALYAGVPFSMTSNLTFYGSLYADELMKSSASEHEMQFQTSELTDNNGLLPSLWSASYEYIYRVNACIEGLNASTGLTPSLKQQLLGEALFFRAFAYFYMVNFFGDVPLVVDTDYQKNTFLPRTGMDKVYVQILDDLKSAYTHLDGSATTGHVYRVNRLSTQAFMARVHLYLQNWEEAQSIANGVIEALGSPTLPAASGVFYSTGTEAILKIMPHGSGYYHIGGQEAYNFVPTSTTSIPTYVFRESFINSFEAGDERRLHWVKSNTVGSTVYHYPYKYKNRQGAGQVEDYQLFRLAEQYLIRAEANAHLENFADALVDVDRIRDRAKLPLLAATHASIGKEQLLELIATENRHEFFAERGHRWLNLRRTGKAAEVLAAVKGSWDAFRSVWPVPYEQIELNKNLLPQNTGY